MPVERASPRPRCLAPVIGPSLKKQKGARKPPSRYFPQTGRVAATADRGPGGASCSELALRGHSLRFRLAGTNRSLLPPARVYHVKNQPTAVLNAYVSDIIGRLGSAT